MAGKGFRGYADVDDLLAGLPDAAAEKLEALLETFGRDINAEQKAAVPVSSGTLKGAIGSMIEGLQLRAGLLGVEKSSRAAGNAIIDQLFANPGKTPVVPRSFGNVYYGRFVEFGRRAQTVRVTRGTSVSSKSASTKRRLKAGLKVRDSYPLEVKAMAPRPFVNIPGLDLKVHRRLADFWSGILA